MPLKKMEQVEIAYPFSLSMTDKEFDTVVCYALLTVRLFALHGAIAITVLRDVRVAVFQIVKAICV